MERSLKWSSWRSIVVLTCRAWRACVVVSVVAVGFIPCIQLIAHRSLALVVTRAPQRATVLADRYPALAYETIHRLNLFSAWLLIGHTFIGVELLIRWRMFAVVRFASVVVLSHSDASCCLAADDLSLATASTMVCVLSQAARTCLCLAWCSISSACCP